MFNAQSWVRLALGLALTTTVSAGVTACGGPQQPEVARAVLKPGNMPADGNWRGVYYDQSYGFLHLEKDGASVMGAWRTEAGDKHGEMYGTVEGDVFRFEWSEHRIGMVGPNATTKGKGYFRYLVPPGENVDHKLEGEWGLGDSDAGHPWSAIKQRNVQPDLASVKPDETQIAIDGGDWDGDRSKNSAGAEGDLPAPPPEAAPSEASAAPTEKDAQK
ncbi:MAG: hypothetical protein RJA70_813 [Pseudomonadota bacterium]|jgi:hypothetical protein